MDDNRTEGSVATYKCNSGYILSGDSTRECGSDGNWTGQQPQCGEYNPRNHNARTYIPAIIWLTEPIG